MLCCVVLCCCVNVLCCVVLCCVVLLCCFFVLLGFVLMSGGGSDDPNVFNEEELFSFRRITLAPFLVILGYGIVLYGIMKKN